MEIANLLNLIDFIEAIEESLVKSAKKDLLPMQPGDVKATWANVDALIQDYSYHPNTSIKRRSIQVC